MARHAFISHSHKDAEASNAIVAALESRGVKCWTAPRDVTPGGSYAESIITAIENSSCFVLVYTQNSNVSPHVLREVERALALGINIIPLRFDDSSISKSLDYLLATVHWLSVIAEPRQTAIRDAADRIASCVIAPDESAPVVVPPLPVIAPPPPARPVEKTPVLLWLLLLLVGLAVIGLSVVTVRRLSSHDETAPPPVATPPSTPLPTANAVVNVPVTPAPTVAALPSAAPVTISTPETTPTPEIAASATPVPIIADVSTPAPPPTPADETTDTTNENVEPTPESTPTPAERPPVNDTPLSAVRRYYAYLGDRNTIKAYEILSAAYRSRETFVNYTRSFASTTGLSLSNTRLTSSNGDTATVSVTFRKNNQKFGWITWSGPVELVREDAGWRIDSTKGLRATRGRK